MFDGVAFGKEMVGIVKGYVSKAIEPMIKRLEAIEATVKGIPAPLTMDDIERAIAAALASLPAPVNGKDADMAEIERQIGEAVTAAMGNVVLPGPDEALVRSAVADEVAKLPPAAAGKDADPYEPSVDEIKAILAPLVADAVSSLPTPQDGKSVKVEELAPLVEKAVSTALSGLREPQDGVGLADAFIDRDGNLVLTLTNGATKCLGQVVGRDADATDIADMVAKAVADIPKPKDGLDGVSFDDMDVTFADDQRTLTIAAAKGENRKTWSFKLAHVLDRGVFREGEEYAKGDGTTFGGSFWIAQKDGVIEKPGMGDGWRLAVKKGRDGKDGVVTEKAAPQPVKVG